MKQEQVIELANKAGIRANESEHAVNAFGTSVPSKWLLRFAKLVEQATLERAKEACEAIEGLYWHGDGAAAATDCIDAIDNLIKDTQ